MADIDEGFDHLEKIGKLGLTMLVGTIGGAFAGQIIDWLPYFESAVPEGIEYIRNAITGSEVSMDHLKDNMDKVWGSGWTCRFISNR
jgi:hypothetical protein